METIHIIKATTGDTERLQQISRQTFSETFAEVNTAENMKKYLEEEFSAEKLTAELNNPGSAFYFATLNSNVIGYLKLNSGPSQTEIKDNDAIEIERIYVLKEYHGKKVGQLPYAKAIQLALQATARYVWLGVWEKNLRAINFYKKNGFVQFDQHIFKLGNDTQTDLMMKLKLKDN
ncbi:MAG: GNAT family N-acetyltransferase [Chitinophagaceae bacterium]|nr:GNAT family N-acetyltransferase [Chitinophagaceae bacterium]